jgi:hypothetical protein
MPIMAMLLFTSGVRVFLNLGVSVRVVDFIQEGREG